MSDHWMLRSDYAELAKTFNSIAASISTVFLFTRLWARKTQYKGLWWDDYFLIAAWALQLIGNGLSATAPKHGFNVFSASDFNATRGWAYVYGCLTAWYIATALVKTAFTATLLRLSTGRVKIVLWLILPVVWVFSIAVATTTWLDLCIEHNELAIQTTCVSTSTYLWIHIGNSISSVCIDFILAYLPWQIVGLVALPKQEKWAVCVSMSLTGFSGILCVVKITQLTNVVELEKQGLDYTYGAIACHGFLAFEVVLYVVAQTIPLLRVLLLGKNTSSKAGASTAMSVAEIARPGSQQQKSGSAPDLDALAGNHADIELVQLPGGRVVAADSEDGKAHKLAQDGQRSVHQVVTEQEQQLHDASHRQGDADEDFVVDDEVHKLWADMGLSRRAWSLSPSPQQAPTRRRQQPGRLDIASSA